MGTEHDDRPGGAGPVPGGAPSARGAPTPGSSATSSGSFVARWQGGIFVPESPIDLPNGARLSIRVTPIGDEAAPGTGARSGIRSAVAATLAAAAGLVGEDRLARLGRAVRGTGVAPIGTAAEGDGGHVPAAGGARRLAPALFALSLLAYAATVLWALDRFPIYFFADEAFHPVRAVELARNGMKDGAGHWLPVYFEAAAQRWTPVFSLYVHLLPAVLLGKSVAVTRATTAVVTILGVAAVALILRKPLGARYWWTGVLLMGLMPAWLLHARTGFETAMMASFYACFLACYLRYRTDRPWCLVPAVLFGAMTFYSYSNGQAVMGVTALFLVLSDLRYHARRWRVVVPAAVIGLVLALPLASFQLRHDEAMSGHLRMIGSYWYDKDLSAPAKAAQFARRYLWGLSPQYWIVSHDVAGGQRALASAKPVTAKVLLARIAAPNLGPLDLERHRYKDLGHVAWWLAPFLVVGLAVVVRRVRSSPTHRAILLAALAAPVGAAMADIGITRVLAFLVPAGVMTGLGLDWVLRRLDRRLGSATVAVVAFGVLAVASLLLVRGAVSGAPRWYSDYGLYGMQYGAIQLYGDVLPSILANEPATKIMMTSEWANGADTFPKFFLTPEYQSRVLHRSPSEVMLRRGELSPDFLWVVTPGEYQQVRASGKFQDLPPERVLTYPDGSPGFYFIRLAYVDGVDAVFEAERRKRAELVREVVEIDGQRVEVAHSLADMGRAQDMFDNDKFTLLRGMEANPLVVELSFPEPRALAGIAGDFSAMDLDWELALTPADGGAPVEYVVRQKEPSGGDVHAEASFDRGPERVSRLRMTIRNSLLGDFANIHVRDLALR